MLVKRLLAMDNISFSKLRGPYLIRIVSKINQGLIFYVTKQNTLCFDNAHLKLNSIMVNV